MKTRKKKAVLSAHRLPPNVVPSFYDMRITPDIAAATFSGEQTVTLAVLEPTKEISFNAAELTISSALLVNDEGTEMVGSVRLDEAAERAIVSFDGMVGSGHWELKLSFAGILNNKLRGFYRCSFKNDAGEEEFMATTKFEPSDARRAFPCWDEPGFKARFKISLVIDAALAGVSNGRLLNETALPGAKKLVEFAPSIKMSSYLVAYIVGRLEASAPVYADGVPIRVWTLPGKGHMAAFALAAAKHSLEYFARYFKTPYPSDKLDLVAIPNFASGAMENFACITFRETALLVDPATASHADLERVADVVSHENAHMWFGDFVTMSWWNGLWLNEAFATFMAAKAVNDWKPEWQVWDGFNVDRAVAMRVDGLRSTRSIEFPVDLPEDARAMFDVLTYQKGCAVLRMLELFLGEEQFREGIVEFLSRHPFGNCDTPALWEAIEHKVASFSDKVSVSEMMTSWIFQPGFPVISVSESQVSGSITLKQGIFQYLGGNGNTNKWHVPVTIRATTDGAVVEKTFCLSGEQETHYLGENVSLVVVNAGGHGFYRVNYSEALAGKLRDNLDKLSAGERFNLVNDLWAAVLGGQAPLSQYLSMVIAMAQGGEKDLNVFTIVLGSLTYMRRVISLDQDVQAEFLALAQQVIMPALSALGWQGKEGESSQDAQLRGQLIGALGAFGDKQVIEKAQAWFELYGKDRATLDTNLVPAVVETLAANGDPARYAEYLALRAAATTPQDETRYLYALASFRKDALVADTLARCLNGDVRTQDAPIMVTKLLLNPAGSRQAWEFVKANWDQIVKAYPLQGVMRVCEGVTGLVDEALAADVRQFFAAHPFKGGEKTVAQNLELLDIAVAFGKREKGWLESVLLVGTDR